ncbi:E3 ubiquitin protein ligase DRIP2 isoform X1 [Dendrobium catenatum]|uniref:E3 ubiquitin protein ligase DRIP2 n=1 Tax=Dendrobium catenatum TaxID=906689 RepID=A0A2I0VJA8_9ASPA|nr:E3 ubiquitin protein ligase DRIP2 isoform X1 [Dendrobium catenatum]PKU63500.1 E3 ubiquitin protein ligase DRIP2 [Dendrobium catenatum]
MRGRALARGAGDVVVRKVGMSSAGMEAGSMQVVRVKREVLAACMTCPLCHKLLRGATTISECLHTFCRQCIFEKLNDEEAECCPICQIDLGCVPEEKLRPDHNLEDVRAKIFPYKRKKVNSPEVVPSITLPVRRKERSLSSLVVNTPRMGAQTSLTGRRTKAVTRRASALRGVSPVIDDSKKKECYNDDLADSSSTETLSKLAHSRRQTSSNAETSNLTLNQDTENSPESYKSELWKPLNCLVEVANRTKSLKSGPQTPAVKAEQTNGPDNESHMYRTKVREHPSKLKMKDEKNNYVPASSAMAKARRMQGVSRKRKEQGPSAQAVLDVADAARERRICPVWLSLLSSADQNGDSPLPQISASYLRIKEGNLPVSSLQKYLVKKLNLASEEEVEIACRGQPVNPTLSLHELTDQWLNHGSSQRVKASVGNSAKDFIMVLTYSRRAQST